MAAAAGSKRPISGPFGSGTAAAFSVVMEEKLPTTRGEVRPEIAGLIEAEGWLPAGPTERDEPRSWSDDEASRPETD